MRNKAFERKLLTALYRSAVRAEKASGLLSRAHKLSGQWQTYVLRNFDADHPKGQQENLLTSMFTARGVMKDILNPIPAYRFMRRIESIAKQVRIPVNKTVATSQRWFLASKSNSSEAAIIRELDSSVSQALRLLKDVSDFRKLAAMWEKYAKQAFSRRRSREVAPLIRDAAEFYQEYRRMVIFTKNVQNVVKLISRSV